MLIIVFYLDLSFLFHIIVINFDILINCFISLEEESERELVEEREVSLDAMIGLDQVPSRLTSAQQGINIRIDLCRLSNFNINIQQ